MKLTAETQSYGATLKGEVAEFRVWAPFQRKVSLRLTRAGSTTEDFPMQPDGDAGGQVAGSLDHDRRAREGRHVPILA